MSCELAIGVMLTNDRSLRLAMQRGIGSKPTPELLVSISPMRISTSPRQRLDPFYLYRINISRWFAMETAMFRHACPTCVTLLQATLLFHLRCTSVSIVSLSCHS